MAGQLRKEARAVKALAFKTVPVEGFCEKEFSECADMKPFRD